MRIIKHRIYLLLLCISSSLWSCNTIIDDPIIQESNITLTYKIDNNSRSFTTATDAENKIKEIAAIFYKDTEQYLAHIVIPLDKSSVEGSLSIMLPEELTQGSYKVILLSNYNRYASGGSTDAYIQSLRSLDYSTARGTIEYTSSSAITELLPMYAVVDEFVISPSQSGDLILEALFKRAVSRIDLHNLATDFQIEWAKIDNYKTGIKPFALPIYSGKASVNNTEIGIIESTNGKNIIGGLYCFPNSVTYSTQDDLKTSYLIIKGLYKNVSYYYRVNILDERLSQNMLMNTIYQVNILEVLAAGDIHQRDAVTNPVSNIRTTISDGSQIEVDSENNYISVSNIRVVLDKSSTSTGSIAVKVNPLEKWTASLDTEGLNHFNISQLDGILKITAKKENTSADALKAIVKIQHEAANNLSINVDIIQTN